MSTSIFNFNCNTNLALICAVVCSVECENHRRPNNCYELIRAPLTAAWQLP